MDKAAMVQAIDGIWTNTVYKIATTAYKSKCWDTLKAALDQFDTDSEAVRDEHRYVVFISDGKDTASTNQTDAVASAAVSKGVKLYCVGYGSSINTNALAYLTSATKGRAYYTQNTSEMADQFGLIGRDIDGQYLLRWATTWQIPFKPSFTIGCQNFVAAFNTNQGVDLVPWFDPQSSLVVGNEMNGMLRFVASASDIASSLNLRAAYVPVYVSRMRFHYRANYPCTVSLKSIEPGEIMNKWSLSETNDGAGGKWLEVATSGAPLPVGTMGNLLRFEFKDMTNPQTAFSLFEIDNTIYDSGMGQNFVIANVNSVTTYVASTPHGTPVSWLQANGFTGDMTAAEMSDPDKDGVPAWQEYVAGTNPRDASSKFTVRTVTAPKAGQPFQITISTVTGKTYRLETATSLGSWSMLQDGIVGTGSPVTVTDTRNLSGVTAVFYRVSVY